MVLKPMVLKQLHRTDTKRSRANPGAATMPQSVQRQSVSPLTLQRLTPIGVILPVYNEQAGLASTLDKIQRYLYKRPHFTFIFVDDGSNDRTPNILTRAIQSAKTPQLQLLSYQPRGGKGHAVKTGMLAAAAHCEFLCFLDGDLAYSLDHLDDLLTALQTADVAIGSRSLCAAPPQGLSWQRKIAGQTFNGLSRLMLGLDYPDMQAGLKGFRQAAAKSLFSKQQLTGFCFDVELIHIARKQGLTIAQIPAQVSAQHQHKLSKVNLVKDSLVMLKDLLRIRFNDWLGRYH